MREYDHYNSEAFVPEEVKAGMVEELVSFLLKQDRKAQDVNFKAGNKHFSCKDIHITSDGYCTIVEWCDKDDVIGECFEFVGEGEQVMQWLTMPDNTSILCEKSKAAEDEVWNEWKAEHPKWKQDWAGEWFEDESLRGAIEDDLGLDK